MMSTLRLRFFPLFSDGHVYAILAACGFSLKAIFVKLAYQSGPVDALTLLAMRMGIALPLFLWLLYAGAGSSNSSNHSASALPMRDIGRIWLLACLGYYLSSLFDFQGLQYISAGLERLILYIYPTLVILLQAYLTRQRPDKKIWQALIVCYIGLAIAFAHDVHQAGQGGAVLIGAGWVFASAVTYALYYLGIGDLVQRVGSMRLTGLAGSASCALVLIHFVLVGQPQGMLHVSSAVWGNAALMALFSTVLPIWWLALAIQRLGAGRAAAIGTLGPVLTVVAAWFFLDDPISAAQLIGLGLVIFGVMRLKK